MNLHEYQSKQLFVSYDISVLQGIAIQALNELELAIETLGESGWEVKAQVQAGGVKTTQSLAEAKDAASKTLGQSLVMYQTDAHGMLVNTLEASGVDVVHELTQMGEKVKGKFS